MPRTIVAVKPGPSKAGAKIFRQPEIAGPLAPSPAHPGPSLKQDELSPSLDQTFDIDLTL